MRRYRIEHEGETIGYCFARSPESALRAFRATHRIPAEINLTATA